MLLLLALLSLSLCVSPWVCCSLPSSYLLLYSSIIDINDRKNFRLVSETLAEDTIVKESERCLHCDEICNICATVCPNFANYSYNFGPIKYKLQKAVQNEEGEVELINDLLFEVNQEHQILNIANFCNECGNCNTFCPTNSAPYKEKPKVWLTKSSFDNAYEGFYRKNIATILYKKNNELFSLKETQGEFIYKTSKFEAILDRANFSILKINFNSNETIEAKFKQAVIMRILLIFIFQTLPDRQF